MEPAPPAISNDETCSARRSARSCVAPPRNSMAHGSSALSCRSVWSRFQCAEAFTHSPATRARQSNQANRGKRMVIMPSRTRADGTAPLNRAR